jgi:16S rRNA G527 N7-methylase RsmG
VSEKLIDIDEAHTLCVILLCIYTRKQATIIRQKRRHISFLSEVFQILTLRYFISVRGISDSDSKIFHFLSEVFQTLTLSNFISNKVS